tara:strand:+ start:12596 stop:12706 length:111 start_codon:yes stop_codon:yes gene_type:complete
MAKPINVAARAEKEYLKAYTHITSVQEKSFFEELAQ